MSRDPIIDQAALLLTDLVDSTLQAERHGDAAMSPWWAAHDRAARDLLAQWRGREIDKSDGFLLLFANVADAVGYAFDYHRALAALVPPLKARAGIHSGALTLRENPSDDVARGAKPVEVDGIVKAIAARVMAAAVGGQTLLTAVARGALGSVGDTLVWHSHGHWRLKGIEAPVELVEVGPPPAGCAHWLPDNAWTPPFAAPRDGDKAYRVSRRGELWVPVRQTRHSLRAERDAFIGRREALRDLSRRLDGDTRLISITGIGGTGKTRLALRCGWQRLGEHSGGIWFCDLSAARSLDGIVHAVALGLDLSLGAEDPVGRIGQALASRGPCLVVLDNFEQVARHAEATLGHWLDHAPDARFIVTTREPLGMSGEEVLRLPPLALLDGATLFMQRAGAANNDFHPDDDDLAAVNPLVQLLDGVPLAIELAAARVRVMSPRALLDGMSRRFDLLAIATGARHPRHATLRATFDWSWDLLSAAERAMLAQLSVFEGGFTPESAAAVVDLSSACEAPAAVMDVLQALVEKSLVRAVSDGRFDLLASVQAYAAERLQKDGNGISSGPGAAERRHWCWFAGYGDWQAAAQQSIESDNLVAACRRAVAAADTVSAVGALDATWAALRLRGPYSVALELVDLLDTSLILTPIERASVHSVAGLALQLLGRGSEAMTRLKAGLDLARGPGYQAVRAKLLCAMGEQMCRAMQLDMAQGHLIEAHAMAVALADRALLCRTLHNLGAVASLSGRHATARSHYEAALAIACELGDERREGALIGNLSTLDFEQGNYQQAEERDRRALTLAQKAGDRAWEGNTRSNLGLAYLELGHNDKARAEFEAARAIAQELALPALEATVLCNLGIVSERDDLLVEAGAHYEAAVRIAVRMSDGRAEGQFRGYLGRLYARVGAHEQATACLFAGEQLLRDAEDLAALALLLCQRAEAEHYLGNLTAMRFTEQQALSLMDTHALHESADLRRALSAMRERSSVSQC